MTVLLWDYELDDFVDLEDWTPPSSLASAMTEESPCYTCDRCGKKDEYAVPDENGVVACWRCCGVDQ